MRLPYINTIPLLYHANRSREIEDLPFWLSLARATGGPVLELGVGTGVICSALVEAGFDVTGLDRDFEMLSFLKLTLPQGLRDNCVFFQGDMTSFHLARTYGLIILACNTLSTLTPGDMQLVFNQVFKHLRPGGQFAADLLNPVILRDLPPVGEIEIETCFNHPVTGYPVQVSNEWERAGITVLVNWHYDHLFPDGRIERTTINTRHFIREVADYVSGLERSGFQGIVQYGDFQQNEYHPAASHLILVAERR